MDFSYFTSAPQPYQYFGLPPTPAGSNTPHGEELRGTLSSEQYDAAFAAFQQSFHYDPSTFLAQPHTWATSPPVRHNSVTSVHAYSPSVQVPVQDTGQDETNQRSSSEEKDNMTPAQSRRKAQNRGSVSGIILEESAGNLLILHRQRAFRERKERHVKDLEAKLNSLERQSQSQTAENERLRRELARFATENEILRATSANGSQMDIDEALTTGPMKYSPTDFSPDAKGLRDSDEDSLYPQKHDLSQHRIVVSEDTGEALLPAGATWDYIQRHELFRRGLVDVGDVCERLKKLARCDGRGPVFEEGDVRMAIAQSAVAGGRDELI